MSEKTCPKPEIPLPIVQRLAEFCGAAKSGNVQLDIVNGQVTGFKLTESMRFDKGKRIGT